MLSHEEMVGIQAEKHTLIDARSFQTEEQYVLHLIHTYAYVYASRIGKNKNVLDVGCNTGYGSEILSKTASNVVAVDVSEKAIEVAKVQHGHLGIEFQCIDGKTLPFRDNEFDIIVSCQVIEHIINYEVFISELKRVLRPGGIVIFTTPNAFLRLDPGMKPWYEFHVREFNGPELESLLLSFFSNVLIAGLDAKEPIYSIEAGRLHRARIGARKINKLKKILPRFAIEALRKAKRLVSRAVSAPPRPAKMFEQDKADQYGLEDFCYRPDNFNTALDLLAICSDDNNSLQKISLS